ncbi:MAG: calcium-binding protein [Solirubrobacteraceae bacterium]|nr:calcium-binding protein [Solirubrobacteraceae bacterium]
MSDRCDRPAGTAPTVRARWRALTPLALGAALMVGGATDAAARTIVGGPGTDILRATSPAGDTLYGGGGPDRLLGGRGNDRFYGGRSANRIDARAGNNYIEGGAGGDNITAGHGRNTIYSGTGPDVIRVGNGNNYIDVGEAPDKVNAGHGNNVLHTGSGGGEFRLGNGANSVYHGSGSAVIVLGRGVNRVYVTLSTSTLPRSLDCGGNPGSTVFYDPGAPQGQAATLLRMFRERLRNCPNVVGQSVPPVPNAGVQQLVTGFAPFNLRGSPQGNDKLLGNHGGGMITAFDGDNILWADHQASSGGAVARSRTTRITAGNGNNEIFGGRGLTIIDVGRGNNMIRAGEGANRITTRGGRNVIRLQGKRSNSVTLIGGRAYVESFANGQRPTVRCRNGARATIVFGTLSPISTCRGTRVRASTALGKRLSLQGIVRIKDSPTAEQYRVAPGQDGIGVARPPLPR